MSAPGTPPSLASPTRVLVAGGGVAALEATLALQALAGDRVEVSLLTRAQQFVYRPLQVLEPLSPSSVVRIPWADIAASLRTELIVDELTLIEPDMSTVITAEGRRRRYDALILAVGATPRQAVSGTVTLGAPGATHVIRRLLGRLRSGATQRIAFVCPPGTSWTIAIYELALLAARVGIDAAAHTELLLVTAESEPLQVLGAEASALMRDLLDEQAIELHTDCVANSFSERRLALGPGGELRADAAIALPRLEGPTIAGIRSTPTGFLTVDDHCRVAGEDNIYAAGDATDYPVKQGGLAAQQADAAAAHVAARAGAGVRATPFQPVLRAALLTGSGSRFLRRELGGSGSLTEVAEEPIWWPPAKIVGRHLAPYLADRIERRP